MRCKEHPKYHGLKPPRVNCTPCRKVYCLTNHETKTRDEIANDIGTSVRRVYSFLAGVKKAKKPHPETKPKEVKVEEPSRLEQLFAKLNPEEQKMLERSLQGRARTLVPHTAHFSTEHFKFGYYSDPHVGVKEFKEVLWMQMLKRFESEGITNVYCPGDNLEGMSGRPGHVYELTHIGAEQQLSYAAQLFDAAPVGMQFYIIDGNHDQWLKQKADVGMVAGRELANRTKNVTFLGEWQARVTLAKGVDMLMFHGNDGTAYADSYKLQKLIESFTGGDKPNIVLSGHYHKQVAIFRRNVFGFECGTLCGQTQFMRGKKLPAHMGYGIIEIWVAPKGGIERLRHEFFPYYD